MSDSYLWRNCVRELLSSTLQSCLQTRQSAKTYVCQVECFQGCVKHLLTLLHLVIVTCRLQTVK